MEEKKFQDKKLNTEKNKRNAKIVRGIKKIGGFASACLSLGLVYIIKKPGGKK